MMYVIQVHCVHYAIYRVDVSDMDSLLLVACRWLFRISKFYADIVSDVTHLVCGCLQILFSVFYVK